MLRPISGLRAAALAAAACLSLTLLAPAAEAAEGLVVVYQPESEQAYQQQLASGQIHAVTVNKRIRTLRVTLANGAHVLAKYPAHTEPQVVAKLKSKGARVTVLGKSAAEQQAKTPHHHKLRYIAAAILVVIVAIVAAVLLVNRRRADD